MLSAIARVSSRRSKRGIRGLEALASQSGGEASSAIALTTTTTTSTSTSCSPFFSAFSSSALAASPSSFSRLGFSRGFAAKPHKNNAKKKGSGSRKGGGGGGKREDSDSEEEDEAAAAAPTSRGGGRGGAEKVAAFDLEATKAKMAAAVERLKKALSGLHAGRASPSMLEHVPVTLVTAAGGGEDSGHPGSGSSGSGSSSSSNTLPLQALAAVTARDANTLVVTPFDPSPQTAAAITSALRLPPLKLDSRLERSGELVVPVPRATPQAVAALAKLARGEAETARVTVRSVRKDANSAARSKDLFSDDERRKNEKAVQAAADEFSKRIDAALAAKEADLAAV